MSVIAKDILQPEIIEDTRPDMLVCKDIAKIYPTPKGDYTVLSDLQLTIKKGEFISIIGHSGCGKSTLLTMIAGLNEISKGAVYVDGDEVRGAGPDRAVVFQSPSLFPWMTALQNVMIGVKQVFPHATKKQKQDICKYYLDKVGLGNDFNKRASELSQGMQQRVGIARGFALKPKVLLLDEPFGMLDSLTRGELQDVLLEVWQKEQITAIMVTHDVDESIFLADRVIMMTSGPFAKIGDELRIPFERPRNRVDILEHPDYYQYRGYLMDFLNH
ncbi:ABC transporter ATP-binding protein [Flammeovirga aprica]|uniref:ABC transporter ATP-binding protein n=1 Tax=Flammeovirga aprica JL-4 TaxID=694437 RepID=A0A7X9P3A3_9BACT|nr:ABC transporter ATP-binding protein [Flammeovirga aprica]NME68227.1 ABC transporter ATP-binding protein [Flammeovirga aprica JL-4]